MKIGVPKEIKPQENRIGLTPESVKTLVSEGHEVIVENNGGSMGGWAEDQYEYQDYENFDSDSFNREVERQFDSILEKIEDGYDGEVNIQGYLDMYD